MRGAWAGSNRDHLPYTDQALRLFPNYQKTVLLVSTECRTGRIMNPSKSTPACPLPAHRQSHLQLMAKNPPLCHSS